MDVNRENEAEVQWKIDIHIAMDLQYPDVVIKKLKAEPNPDKRQHILTDARLGYYRHK